MPGRSRTTEGLAMLTLLLGAVVHFGRRAEPGVVYPVHAHARREVEGAVAPVREREALDARSRRGAV